MFIVLLLIAIIYRINSSILPLITFDKSKADTFFDWKLINDPVMGGSSFSNFTISKNNTLIWIGEVKDVEKLKAPGFCNAETTNAYTSKFNDISGFNTLEIKLRSFIKAKGFKISFAANTLNPQFASFKAPFEINDYNGQWQIIQIPFNRFSNDWSAYTGDCFTKDPNGKQHICCTSETPQVCPTDKDLKKSCRLVCG